MRFLNCLLLVVINAVPCGGQNIFDAHTISGSQNNYISSHAIDPLGNKYLSIYTDGGNSVSIYGKSYNLDVGNYILRFDASDSLTLIYELESIGVVQDRVQALAADKDGNLYVASQYYNGYGNLFRYSKYSPDGKLLWQVQEGTDVEVESEQILIDDNGNSYVAGNVSSVYFFGILLYKYIVYPNHDFLLKFSSTGSLTWIHTSDASDYDVFVNAMRFDNQGNIILGGEFHTQIKIGSDSLTNLIGDNFANMYMACISPSGNLQWLKGFIGEGYFVLYDIEVDPAENYYFCGSFYGTTTFGDTTLSTFQWDYPNFIMGKVSNNFDVQWIKFKDAISVNLGPYNWGGYLANTSNGILVSGTAYGGFQIDNLTLPMSSNLQAFVAKVMADGTTSWLKGYGDALVPASYFDAPFFFRAGYQLSRITDQCYFISGNFVTTLNTNDGVITAQSRDVFTGIFAESRDSTNLDLGPDVSGGLCSVDTSTISLNSTLGTNYFSIVQGTMPTVTFINGSEARLSNIAYGVTKFKWIVQNCTSMASKLITINRISTDAPQQPDTTAFCKSQLNNAIVTVNGDNILWYGDESLTHQIQSGNTFVPTVSDTVYVTEGVPGCVSKPTQIIISVINNPEPPTGQTIQTLVVGETIGDLIVSGSDVQWYSSSGIALPSITPLENDSTYFAIQTVSGCESQPLAVKVSVITAVMNYDPSLLYYPNPVKDNLIVSFGTPIDQVVVTNILGQTLITIEGISNTTELSFGCLASGIYFVQVRSSEKLMSFKIVKD